MDDKFLLTRRQFLALGITVLLLGGVGASIPKLRRYRSKVLDARHQVESRDETPLDAHVLSTTVAFTGALYGVVLTDTDRVELEDRIQFCATEDSGWGTEFAWLTGFVDQLARKEGASRFVDANPAERDRLVQSIMGESIQDRRHRLLALVSGHERDRRRFSVSTVSQLQRVYLTTGAPWRRRGYQSWPGIPGDPWAYTRAERQYAC